MFVNSAFECACHIKQKKKHVPEGIHALIEVKRPALSILICMTYLFGMAFILFEIMANVDDQTMSNRIYQRKHHACISHCKA